MIRRTIPSLLLAAAAVAVLLPSPVRAAQGVTPGEAAVTGSADPWVPAPALSSPSGPAILRLPPAAPGVVAMRLSVPIREEEIEGGWAQVIAALARGRLSGLVTPLGVEAEVSRTPWGIAYSVSGPETDFDYLAWILRELTGLPDLARVEEARTLLRRDRARRQETGRGRAELDLRSASARATPPVFGTAGTIEALSAGGVRELWIRTHRPENMTLLVSGEVSPPLLLASFAEVGTRDAPPAPPVGVRVPQGPSPERLDLIRTSVGVAWSRNRPLSPAAAIAAVLLTQELRAADPGFEARVVLWETPGHSVLALVGAAFSRDLPELRRWISGGLDRLRDDLDPAVVSAIADDLRAQVLVEASTPAGQLRLVGRFLDAGLGPNGLVEYLVELDTMTPDRLESALAQMADSDPVEVEVRR